MQQPGTGHAGHDHAAERADALDKAEALCRARGTRLTELRRRVLELIWASPRPSGAYAILEALRQERRAEPPTVYRALDFLIENRLVHRIESLNAYVGCGHPDAPHSGQFLICTRCHGIAEIEDEAIDGAVHARAERAGFAISGQTIEISGLCHSCQAA